MRTKLLLLSLITMILLGTSSTAVAESKLQLKVITSSQEGFWVNSTLVYGEKEAILIDAQFTQSDAHRLVANLIESRKNLTTVYVTHAHPDHYFGFNIIKQAFPNVKIVALPSTVTHIKETWEGKVKQWKPAYGDNITSSPIIPEPLQGKALMLEGETIEIVGGVQGDTMDSSYIWIPSLKAVVCGDIVYNGVFPWTAESTPVTRKEWIKTLDEIAALKPSVVVAGHKNPNLKDDLSGLELTKSYLDFYDLALASSKTKEEFMTKVKDKFPDLGLEVILKLGSDAAFSMERKN